MRTNLSDLPDRLSGISAFVAAVEAGSFSAAAERLHLSRSAVGKSVARLEARLGVRLFHRTTRRQHLTEDGETFYRRCTRVLAELGDAEDELSAGRQAPTGKLRVTMPVQLGRRCIAPVLVDLARQHPQLRLELGFSDRRVDLVEDGFDLAIRSGRLDDTPGLKARALGEQTMMLCASPSYLAERGTPTTLEAMAGHDLVAYGRAGRPYEWPLFDDGTPLPPGGKRERVRLAPPRVMLDDLIGMLDAARAGMGIACVPNWVARDALAAGELVWLLPHARARGVPLHLVWPDTRHPSAKLRAAIDALVANVPDMLNGDPARALSATRP